jgi:NADH oxidoreductase Hcr
MGLFGGLALFLCGICGTCMCTLVSGSVEQTAVSGLTEDEEAAGKILICSSKIRGDIHLKVD